jgi:hypothetical protein
LATITEKQIQTRRVVQTLYIPLPVAIQIDDEAKRSGVSRSTLINQFIAQGLNNNNKTGLLHGVPGQAAAAETAAVISTTALSNQGGSDTSNG